MTGGVRLGKCLGGLGAVRPLTLGPPLRLQIAGRSFGVRLGIKGPLLQLSNTRTGALTSFHFLPRTPFALFGIGAIFAQPAPRRTAPPRRS